MKKQALIATALVAATLALAGCKQSNAPEENTDANTSTVATQNSSESMNEQQPASQEVPSSDNSVNTTENQQ